LLFHADVSSLIGLFLLFLNRFFFQSCPHASRSLNQLLSSEKASLPI
jgi:hypothetical protein